MSTHLHNEAVKVDLSSIRTHINTYREFRVQLTCMYLDCGWKPENPEGTHAATGRTCKLHTEGPPRPGSEPGALLL